MKNNKIVLAYSGGLDTSFCIKYLNKEKGLEIHAALVNTGGFSKEDIAQIERKAYELGAVSFKALEITNEFYDKSIKFLVFGNILRNNTYPLSVSAERMFQAIAVAEYAQAIGAVGIAHGSTGAGNDQVRFDLVFNTLAGDLDIITPIRDLQLSRQDEISFLQKNGVDWPWEKGQYSINKGIWGTSVGGKETLTSNQPLPESVFPSQLKKIQPEEIQLLFEGGQLTGINDQLFGHPVEAISRLQELASPYAIGRDIHVGDTIIGIKGRVGFEAAAPLIIIKAHHTLEKHVLSKWQQYWKEQLANWYGMLLHEGQFLDPVMRNIESFMESTQIHVTGTVNVKLRPYHFEIQGIASDFDLMTSTFGQYGEMNKDWSGEDVKGFTKILGNASKIHHFIHQKETVL